MMDPSGLFIDPYHPSQASHKLDLSGFARHYTRTQRPVKYYLIDFGRSQKFDSNGDPPLVLPIPGGDKSVPEYYKMPLEPCDPFATDVYYIGNFVRESFTEVCSNPFLSIVV